MKEYIINRIKQSIDVKQNILEDDSILEQIVDVAKTIIIELKNNNKVLIFGNGGSASDAQHIAAEFVGRFETERDGLPVVALSCNSSNLTAVGNDYGFEDIFVRQINALGNKGDIAIGISTSGNSGNIIKALETAKSKDMITVGFTGESECKMDEVCDEIIHVPSKITARIQESHILIGHIICGLVDKAFE